MMKHFRLEELVNKEFFNTYGEKAWLVFDNRILRLADALRDIYGPCTINNWLWDGDLQYCGFRENDSIGAELSQHKFGRALDLHFHNITAEEVRKDILAKKFELWEDIKGMEKDVSWLHIDVRNEPKLKVF